MEYVLFSMRPKICGWRSFFGGMGSRPAAERICLRRCARRACHSASVLYVRAVKWVSVFGISVLRASFAGIGAGICACSAPQTKRVSNVRMASRSKRPDPFDGLTHDPILVFGVEELHLVAHHTERTLIGGDVLHDGPVGGPHQALGTES